MQKEHEIMEAFLNKEGNVAKYVHANGTETCIKTVPTCISPGITIPVHPCELENRNKAVMFLSVSVGCNLSCKFCYVTNKRCPYKEIDSQVIVKSAIESINRSKKMLKGKYLKISFMGMGDYFNSNIKITDICQKIFRYAYNNGIIAGIDGVDIGTSWPDKGQENVKNKFLSISSLSALIDCISIPRNPFYEYSVSPKVGHRTPVRLFISLHSINDMIRKYLMPCSAKLEEIIEDIESLSIDIVFHYVLFDGINDSEKEIKEITEFFKKYKSYELRLLRYNPYPGIDLRESMAIKQTVAFLKNSDVNFKYQVSAGSDIQASCGQFICKPVN